MLHFILNLHEPFYLIINTTLRFHMPTDGSSKELHGILYFYEIFMHSVFEN